MLKGWLPEAGRIPKGASGAPCVLSLDHPALALETSFPNFPLSCVPDPSTFFLTHERLKKLERDIILEVEGETKPWFMKLMRHEAAHAYSYAYQLYKKKKWQQRLPKLRLKNLMQMAKLTQSQKRL